MTGLDDVDRYGPRDGLAEQRAWRVGRRPYVHWSPPLHIYGDDDHDTEEE